MTNFTKNLENKQSKRSCTSIEEKNRRHGKDSKKIADAQKKREPACKKPGTEMAIHK